MRSQFRPPVISPNCLIHVPYSPKTSPTGLSPQCLVTCRPHLRSSAHSFLPAWNTLLSAHSQCLFTEGLLCAKCHHPHILLPWGFPDNFGPCSCLSLLISDTTSCWHYTSGHLITFWASHGIRAPLQLAHFQQGLHCRPRWSSPPCSFRHMGEGKQIPPE